MINVQNLSFMPAYQDGKPGLQNIPWKKGNGVYFIKENDDLVYVGKGNKNRLFRHFHRNFDPTRPHVNYKPTLQKNRYEIAYHQTSTANQATKLEAKVISILKPRDNKNFKKTA